MILFKHSEDIAAYLQNSSLKGKKTGFVPTMGALHKGHISLISRSVQETDITICSIFINPTQFNDPNDFQKYPVTLERDIALLESAGTDVLFLPFTETIYPLGTANLPHFELGELENRLEGAFRPGHFQGVCQVMDRLLHIIHPQELYMGAKDFQQCMVVAKLLEITGLDTRLHVCPTLREPGGLAMSSRNARLDPGQLEKATTIYRALQYIRENLKPGDIAVLKQNAREMLRKEQFRVDYVEMAYPDTLEPIGIWDGKQPLTALIAAFLGEVRLIDNMTVSG